MDQLKALYKEYTAAEPLQCMPITGSGSNRQYFRMTNGEGQSLIGVVGANRDENNAFVYLTRHFTAKGLPVPQLLAVSDDGMRYLQSDLGHRSLYDALKEGRERGGAYAEHEVELLRKTISLLPKVQLKGAEDLDFTQCYPQECMDETNAMFDLNYFKYCFLMPSDVAFHELKLEKAFRQLAEELTQGGINGFLYRDFQARNIILDDAEEPQLIDYQGGRRGPVEYDLASFLWQASARYPGELRQKMVDIYLRALQQYTAVDEQAFRTRLQRFVLFRQLQVLGAYGFRGYMERKKYFLDSIPLAIANLSQLLREGACPNPYLEDVLTRLVTKHANDEKAKKMQPTTSRYDNKGALKIRIFSFSYRKGIPADESGNGGGYVFDCRSTHNPGRYEPYKQLTGLDAPVIQFLEDDGEILIFLESVYKLADAHVERYIKRGFTDLMFSFGCTGGQHRSVYSAQHLAEHLNAKYGVEVQLLHREQGISSHFSAREKRKAMVFAAGLGTRLKPLTDTMPKALVPLNGRPLLEILTARLNKAGFDEIVVNVHHFAEQIKQWTQDRKGIRLSDESDCLLETGGGIRHAAPLLRDAERFLIHNVDILSNVDLDAFWQTGAKADAMLLVSERQTQRYLLFNEDMRLVGWTNIATGEVKTPYEDLDITRCRRLAFAGIHQMHTSLIDRMQGWPDKFSIIEFYLSVCKDYDIRGYVQPDLKMMDVGKLDTLAQAEAFAKELEG